MCVGGGGETGGRMGRAGGPGGVGSLGVLCACGLPQPICTTSWNKVSWNCAPARVQGWWFIGSCLGLQAEAGAAALHLNLEPLRPPPHRVSEAVGYPCTHTLPSPRLQSFVSGEETSLRQASRSGPAVMLGYYRPPAISRDGVALEVSGYGTVRGQGQVAVGARLLATTVVAM